MATPVVLTTGARPIVPVESGGVPMTPVDTLGEPVTVVDTLGEPVVLINEDGTPAFLAYSAKTYLAGVAPYHWFDFVNDRCLYASNDVGGVSGATGYSFTRASDGYYTNADGTLTLFGSGALRRGDRGVLIEGSRTNLCLQSQTLDNATNWTVGNAVVSANAATAPDGTLTADQILGDGGGSGTVQLLQAFNLSTSTTYTFSLFAKAALLSWLAIGTRSFTAPGDVDTYFQLSGSGSVGSTGAGHTASISAFGNGWYRCVVTVTFGADAVGTFRVFLADGDGDITVSRTTAASLNVWGAQLEAASFASSYIPTVAASATRAADVLTYTVNTTAQIQAAVAGQPELVTNGGFATDTDWTKGADWTISAGTANYNNAGGAQVLSQAISLVEAKFYAVTYTVSALSSGFIYARLQGGSNINGATRTANGTYTELIAAPSAPTAIGFVAQGVLSIDNVSVKEVPANSLTLYPLQLWSEFERAVDTGGDETLLTVDAGSGANDFSLYVATNDRGGAFALAASIVQFDQNTVPTLAVGSTNKLAARLATNDARACSNGTLSTADATVTLPTDPTRLRLPTSFQYIRRIAVIQGAGTDANLQAMTS